MCALPICQIKDRVVDFFMPSEEDLYMLHDPHYPLCNISESQFLGSNEIHKLKSSMHLVLDT